MWDEGPMTTGFAYLKPEKYVLNVPGHFAAGMWTEFTVKP